VIISQQFLQSATEQLLQDVEIRVTTCLENLETSGNLEHVRDVVNSQGIVREEILSWKSVPKIVHY